MWKPKSWWEEGQGVWVAFIYYYALVSFLPSVPLSVSLSIHAH